MPDRKPLVSRGVSQVSAGRWAGWPDFANLIMIMYCTVTGRGDPGRCLAALFTLVTNPLIAFMALRPVSFASLRSAELSLARENSLNPLPAPPPGAAAKADDPLYWATLQNRAQVPAGAPDIVPPSEVRQASKLVAAMPDRSLAQVMRSECQPRLKPYVCRF
jgi:hypothetical protein